MAEGAPISMRPVGFVRTEATREALKERFEELEAEIEIHEPYESALEGIDGFSHLIVLFFMHEVPEGERDTLQVKPRGLLRHGLTPEELPTIGVFACDSPVRPNPVGVSVVEVVERRGRSLRVKGLDAFDGTPVLDIKPYTPDRAVPEADAPGWHRELLRKAGAKRV